MDPNEAYQKWAADPTPDNLNQVVRALDRPVSFAISQMGLGDNPQMKHQARLFAAEAVKTYDPSSGTSLSTWAQSNLRSINRYRRENSGPVKVPERAQIDAWHIEDTRRRWIDEHGEEPDIKQLADATKLSVKRITDVRRLTRPVAHEGQVGEVEHQYSDFLGEALEYLYDESDYIDRKIIEHITGYGGEPLLQKNELAKKLRISPSQVTRRSERLAQKLAELEADLEDVAGV